MIKRYQGSVFISSVILVFIVLTLCSLGVWQFSRMVEKQHYLQDIDKKNQIAAMNIEDVIDSNKIAPNVWVGTRGPIDPQVMWLVDNQQFENEVGYHVIAVLKTVAGNVLVNLGWVPALNTREIWPDVNLAASIENEKGVIVFPSTNPFVDYESFEVQQQEAKKVYRIQGVDVKEQTKQFGADLLPFIVVLTEPSDQFKRQWQPVVMPPQKHLAYAIQWFGLAIAAAVIGIMVIIKSRKINE